MADRKLDLRRAKTHCEHDSDGSFRHLGMGIAHPTAVALSNLRGAVIADIITKQRGTEETPGPFNKRPGVRDAPLGLRSGGGCVVTRKLNFLNIFEGFSHAINKTFYHRCVISLVRLDGMSITEWLHRLPGSSPF